MSLINFTITTSQNAPSVTDWVSVIIYFFTLCAAIYAAYTAKKALNENKKLTKIQTEPFVDIKLEIMPESTHWIRLKISNLGLSSAFFVQFRFKGVESKNEVVINNIISGFTRLGFMRDGLNYLSKGDVRYSSFINLLESDQKRGFSVEEFLKVKLGVEIAYTNKEGTIFNEIFVISMNELEGSYTIGKSFHEEVVENFKELNQNLKKIVIEQDKFKNEYEKTHRDWTEQELRQQINILDRKRELYKRLGKELPVDFAVPKRKLSIQQIRKQMK